MQHRRQIVLWRGRSCNVSLSYCLLYCLYSFTSESNLRQNTLHTLAEKNENSKVNNNCATFLLVFLYLNARPQTNNCYISSSKNLSSTEIVREYTKHQRRYLIKKFKVWKVCLYKQIILFLLKSTRFFVRKILIKQKFFNSLKILIKQIYKFVSDIDCNYKLSDILSY